MPNFNVLGYGSAYIYIVQVVFNVNVVDGVMSIGKLIDTSKIEM